MTFCLDMVCCAKCLTFTATKGKKNWQKFSKQKRLEKNNIYSFKRYVAVLGSGDENKIINANLGSFGAFEYIFTWMKPQIHCRELKNNSCILSRAAQPLPWQNAIRPVQFNFIWCCFVCVDLQTNAMNLNCGAFRHVIRIEKFTRFQLFVWRRIRQKLKTW